MNVIAPVVIGINEKCEKLCTAMKLNQMHLPEYATKYMRGNIYCCEI